MLTPANLQASIKRVRIPEIIGHNGFPLSAGDIFGIPERSSSINRVTVYHIFDHIFDLPVDAGSSNASEPAAGPCFYWCPSLGTMQIKRNIPSPAFLNWCNLSAGT